MTHTTYKYTRKTDFRPRPPTRFSRFGCVATLIIMISIVGALFIPSITNNLNENKEIKDSMDQILIIPIIVGALILIWVLLYYVPLGLYFQATLSGIRISIFELIFMRFRKVPPAIIINSMIECSKAGVIVKRDELEALFLAGGNIDNVSKGLIFAKASGIKLSFKDAAQLDLAKKDIITELEKN